MLINYTLPCFAVVFQNSSRINSSKVLAVCLPHCLIFCELIGCLCGFEVLHLITPYSEWSCVHRLSVVSSYQSQKHLVPRVTLSTRMSQSKCLEFLQIVQKNGQRLSAILVLFFRDVSSTLPSSTSTSTSTQASSTSTSKSTQTSSTSTSTQASSTSTSTSTLFSLQVHIKYAIAKMRKDWSFNYRTNNVLLLVLEKYNLVNLVLKLLFHETLKLSVILYRNVHSCLWRCKMSIFYTTNRSCGQCLWNSVVHKLGNKAFIDMKLHPVLKNLK